MDKSARQRLLAASRGDGPADLLFSGGTVVNVFTGELVRADVAVCDGLISSVGPRREAAHVEDVSGRFLIPGLIDAHVHLESSLVTPAEFARAVVPRGTTAVICDPHEIANVAGLDGIRWMLDTTESLPLTVFGRPILRAGKSPRHLRCISRCLGFVPSRLPPASHRSRRSHERPRCGLGG